MVTNKATETLQSFSFMTAPPIIHMASKRRFRARRNLPYKDAKPYKASLYYWWWAFLKRNKQYQRTCLKRGKAKFCQVYHDFGNIFEFEFKTWWETRKFLFSEQSALIEKRNMDAARDGLLYRIDPSRSFNQIQQEIKAIHMQAHAIMPANSQRRRSSAKYPIYVNASAYNLYRVLRFGICVVSIRTCQPMMLGLWPG